MSLEDQSAHLFAEAGSTQFLASVENRDTEGNDVARKHAKAHYHADTPYDHVLLRVHAEAHLGYTHKHRIDDILVDAAFFLLERVAHHQYQV